MQRSIFRTAGGGGRRRTYGGPQGSRRGGGSRNGQYIDPTKYVNKASNPVEAIEFVPEHTFADFGFDARILQNLEAKNYVHPSAIQDGALKPGLAGRDMIGLANTGTGKTAAFLLPIIQRMLDNPGHVRALVMAPTRELAVQIDDEFKAFSRGLQLYSALCVGGANMGRQIMALKKGPQIVIGTPGRLKDLMQQRALKLHNTNVLVLDEADRMLDMGFIKDIRFIIGALPKQRQSFCFSATVTPDINALLKEMLHDPVTVSVRTSETSDHVEQNVIEAHSPDHKLELLTHLLTKPDFDKVLVFGQTKHGVQRLSDKLSKAGTPSEAIHGNKSQSQRQRALKAFKENKVKVLVATDVAARGLDIPNVSHVINFDQPQTYDDYVHRIGRTGRAGNRGHALTFIPPQGRPAHR